MFYICVWIALIYSVFIISTNAYHQRRDKEEKGR